MNALGLMYHDVVDRAGTSPSGFRGAAADAYKLERAEFELQLEAIARITPPVSVELVAEQWDSRRPVFLTFDDGGSSAGATIAASLERRGWRGHFMVPTEFIGRPGFLTREQIRGLRHRGHAIGSHSCSHPHFMASCRWDELLKEWSTSADVLSEILEERVSVASVPGGDYSRRVAAAASAAGYRVLFTSMPTTKVRTVEGCLIVGRYVVRPGTRPDHIAALAAGDRWSRVHRGAVWAGKRVLKFAGRPILKRLRGSHPSVEPDC